MADVRLVDLDVIKRYSLAIRQESAPAAELLASLDASRAMVLAAMTARRPTVRTRPPLAARIPVRPPAAKRATKTTAKRATPTKKAAPAKRRTTR